MNTASNVWEYLTRLVLFLLFAAFLLGVGLWYLPVIKQNEQMRKRKFELETRIDREVEISKRLEASAKSLQDPRTVERLARERLRYARPGEKVVFFESAPPAAIR